MCGSKKDADGYAAPGKEPDAKRRFTLKVQQGLWPFFCSLNLILRAHCDRRMNLLIGTETIQAMALPKKEKYVSYSLALWESVRFRTVQQEP
jgi:hypothetical protein